MVITTKPAKLFVVPLFFWGVVFFIGGGFLSLCIVRLCRFGLPSPLTVTSIFEVLFTVGLVGGLLFFSLREALKRTRWFWLEGGTCHWRSLRSHGKIPLPIKSICQVMIRSTLRGSGRRYPVSLTQLENDSGANKLLVQRTWPMSNFDSPLLLFEDDQAPSVILIEEAWFAWTARRLHTRVSQHLQIQAETWVMSPGETIHQKGSSAK